MKNNNKKIEQLEDILAEVIFFLKSNGHRHIGVQVQSRVNRLIECQQNPPSEELKSKLDETFENWYDREGCRYYTTGGHKEYLKYAFQQGVLSKE